MKRFSKLVIPFFLLIFLFIFLPSIIHAQGIGGGGCDYQDPDIPCPIDSGLIVLLSVGVGYGIMKVIAARKTQL